MAPSGRGVSFGIVTVQLVSLQICDASNNCEKLLVLVEIEKVLSW